MNESQVRNVFAEALLHSPADRLDIDDAIRKGRSLRRRRHYGLGVSVAFVALLVGLVVAEIGPDRRTSTGRPSTQGSLVTDGQQISGRWLTLELYGRDVSGFRDAAGQPLAASFVKLPDRWGWVANEGCNNVSGSFVVTATGDFSATAEATSTGACPPSGPSATDNVQAVKEADRAHIEPSVTTDSQLTLIADDQVIGRYVRAS